MESVKGEGERERKGGCDPEVEARSCDGKIKEITFRGMHPRERLDPHYVTTFTLAIGLTSRHSDVTGGRGGGAHFHWQGLLPA